MSRRLGLVLVAAAAVGAAACGRVDLAASVKVTDVTTGWFDAGITADGKNKLVPSISLRLQNVGQKRLGSTQLNLIFKKGMDKDEWTTAFVRGIGSEGLPPGQNSPPIVVRAQQGYTGIQPRAQLLSHKEFVDFKVEVFGKHGSATWVKLGEFPITRQLLTR